MRRELTVGVAGTLGLTAALWLPLPGVLAATLVPTNAELATQEAAFYDVTRVVDGDTVVLDSVGTVRLIGIDTPETVDPRKPVEYFGLEASAHLREMLSGERVRLEFDQTRRDRYGRTLAYLYLSDGRFVNKEMVLQGYAHAYVKYPFRYMDEFIAAEKTARDAERGLWRPQKLETAGRVVVALGGESSGRALITGACRPGPPGSHRSARSGR